MPFQDVPDFGVDLVSTVEYVSVLVGTSFDVVRFLESGRGKVQMILYEGRETCDAGFLRRLSLNV